MSDPFSRVINLLVGVHEIRNGGFSALRAAAMSPKHFPKTLSSVMLLSGISGYCIMGYIDKARKAVCGISFQVLEDVTNLVLLTCIFELHKRV